MGAEGYNPWDEDAQCTHLWGEYNFGRKDTILGRKDTILGMKMHNAHLWGGIQLWEEGYNPWEEGYNPWEEGYNPWEEDAHLWGKMHTFGGNTTL